MNESSVATRNAAKAVAAWMPKHNQSRKIRVSDFALLLFLLSDELAFEARDALRSDEERKWTSDRKGAAISDICRELGFNVASAVEHVNRLSEEGFVESKKDWRDNRKRWVTLTARSKKILKTARRAPWESEG